MDNVNLNNHNDNRRKSSVNSPYSGNNNNDKERENSLGKRSSRADRRASRGRTSSPNNIKRKSSKDSKINKAESKNINIISPIKKQTKQSFNFNESTSKDSGFFSTDKISRPTIHNNSNYNNKDKINESRYSKISNTNSKVREKDQISIISNITNRVKLIDGNKDNITNNNNETARTKKSQKSQQLSLTNLKGVDFSNIVSKNNFFGNGRNSTTNTQSKNETSNDTEFKRTNEIIKLNSMNNAINSNAYEENKHSSTVAFKRIRNKSFNNLKNIIAQNPLAETSGNLYMDKARKIMIDNKMSKLIEHFDLQASGKKN